MIDIIRLILKTNCCVYKKNIYAIFFPLSLIERPNSVRFGRLFGFIYTVAWNLEIGIPLSLSHRLDKPHAFLSWCRIVDAKRIRI